MNEGSYGPLAIFDHEAEQSVFTSVNLAETADRNNAADNREYILFFLFFIILISTFILNLKFLF